MANKLSDYNQNGTASNRVSEAQLFSDLNLKMPIHPNRKDIIPLTDIDAIKQSVRNLVLTNRGEKPFREDIGGNITGLLFENYSRYMGIDIRLAIERVLKNYERRVTDVTVQVTPTADENAVTATVGFKLNNIQREFDLEFALNRLR
jgi:phage baseplate assembly protein W